MYICFNLEIKERIVKTEYPLKTKRAKQCIENKNAKSYKVSGT